MCIHLKKRHKRTKPAPLGLFLESIPSKCAKELNFHAKDLTETQDNDEESSNTALMSTSGVFLENPRQNIEEEFENHNDPKDYSKERTDYIKHNKEKMDFEYSLLLTDNLVPTNTSTNPFEDLFPSKNIMNSEMSTSLFDNHELRHTSTINQERSMELTEVSKELEDDTHELVQATLNANIKTNKPSILQDIKNYRDILNSKQKSEIKGTPKYIDKNLETNTVHKNSINHRLTNIDYLSSNTIGITPAKHNMNINNLSSSDTENNSKPVYQTPSIEKKVLRKCTPYNDTLSKGNFRKNKSNFYTPSCREDKENIDSLGSKTVSKLEVCKKEAHLKMKLVKELKEMTPAKQSFMDIKDHYMFSGGAEPKGKDSLDDDSGQGTLLNTIVVKEINILKRNEAYESHQVQQSEILSKIPETSLFSNQKNELSYVNMIVSTDADELKRYETNEFRHRQQSENHKKILQDKLTSNQKNGLSSALSGEVNFSNAPLVSRNGEKGHFKDTFDLRLKKSLDENQILYCKKEHYLSINGKNYEVQHLLGKGGSSKVFQVRDIETSQQLAVKVVDLSRAEKSIAEGYLNEITLLRRLQGYETVIKMID
ncbi:hypothetical protein C0J52_26894 [Blattella germanica]|nr:hypothetical protein C0J52_26894 [Blattella germanica]